MENYQNDSTSPPKGHDTAQLKENTGVAISMEGDGKDESLNEASTSTSINMEQINHSSNTFENKDSFLTRQSSTPEGTASQRQMNRLQQMHESRSVGAPRINMNVMGESSSAQSAPLTAPILNPSAVRQFGFWRDVFSLSTAPSKEALRSLIENSNSRYQPIGDNAVSQHPLSLNDPDGSTSGSISMRMSSNNDNSGMVRSNSVKKDKALGLEMASNNPFTSTNASTSNSASSPRAAGSNVSSQEDNNRDQMILYMLSYVPITLILLVKFVYDHWDGISDLLLLQIVLHFLNRILTKEVARLEQKRYCALISAAILGSVVITLRLRMATDPPDPFGLIIPPPRVYTSGEVAHNKSFMEQLQTLDEVKREHQAAVPVGLLFYYAAVSDLVLRLCTILIKIGITLLPMHEMQMKFRARLYALLECISQLYRSLTPITQWISIFYGYYDEYEFISPIQLIMYLIVKIFELKLRFKNLRNAITVFRSNIDSKRAPTKDELDAADTVCPICNDPYKSPIILECGHIFCYVCVQTWFRRERTCPMCRAKVSDDPTWQNGSTTFSYQLY